VLGLRQLAVQFREVLAGSDPGVSSSEVCAEIAEELARTEKACAAARVRYAARASESGEHRRRGFADASDWMARWTGSTTGEARAALATLKAVASCPATKDALAAGEVSLTQAREIASVPEHEAELLEIARTSGARAVRDAARKYRLEAIDPEELSAKQHAAREFAHWKDDLGMIRFRGALPPSVGVAFANRLDRETDREWRAAKREHRLESRAAHAADAFVRMLAGTGPGTGTGKARTADLVIVQDLRAYRRGHAHPGEVSHIIGGGPIPVRVARELAKDAFLKAVLHDGVTIHTVVHFGRRRPAELNTALELGAPPEFDGVTCDELGCDRKYGLQWDHVDPVANQGPTSKENLRPLCWPHHDAKTARDRAAGLLKGRRNRPERGPP
jgi:hypothetical protein